MEIRSAVLYAIFAGAVLVASSVAAVYQQALGTVALSGQTKVGTFGLSYTHVTAEAAGGHYHSTLGDGLGFWTLNADNGISYTVDASKDGYNHPRKTGIVGPQSGIIHTLSTSTQYNIEFFIVSDEEFRAIYGSGTAWHTAARDKLFAAQSYFKDDHNIHFTATYYYDTWDSNDSNGTCAMKDEVQTETNWDQGSTYRHGADLLWAVSGQHINGQPTGCADIPAGAPGGNNYPGSLVLDFSTDYSDVVMHELSHNYGMQHNVDTWVDIMYYGSNPAYYGKNWRPSNDDIMISHRSWY